MLTNYRRALGLPGAWRFTASGAIARLPIAMDTLGIVLLISSQTGAYALAGILLAAFQVSAAVGGLLSSRLIDQVGQHRLLPWLAIAHGLGLVAFVVSVETGLPVLAQGLIVAFAGLCQPAVGSMVRARWAHVATDPSYLRGGFALESIVDEMIFSVGPMLTAFLAFQIALPLPLIVAAVLAVSGSLLLAAQRSTEPPASGRRRIPKGTAGHEPRRSALAMPGVVVVVIGALGVGGVFGSYEVSVVAFTQQAGASGMSGVILGLWAFGSMLGGLIFGARQWHRPLPQQVLILTAIMAAVLLPAPFVRSIPVLIVTTFLAGFAVAPALIAIFSLTERLVPPALLTEGLTWANSGLAIGFSAGTAAAGAVVDAVGTTWAFTLPFMFAAAAVVTAGLGRRVLKSATAGRPMPLPSMAWNDDPVPGPGPGGFRDDPDDSDAGWRRQ